MIIPLLVGRVDTN